MSWLHHCCQYAHTTATATATMQKQQSLTGFPADIAQSRAEKPVQPFHTQFPNTLVNGKYLSFQTPWYEDKSWLEYSIVKDVCYCYACHFFHTSASDSLLTSFCVFLQAREGLLLFTAVLESDAMVAWQQYKINQKDHTCIAHRLDQIGERVIQENQHYLKTICEVILLCAQQKIALRSHNKSDSLENPGNFWQL